MDKTIKEIIKTNNLTDENLKTAIEAYLAEQSGANQEDQTPQDPPADQNSATGEEENSTADPNFAAKENLEKLQELIDLAVEKKLAAMRGGAKKKPAPKTKVEPKQPIWDTFGTIK